jgi:hypothetical protein
MVTRRTFVASIVAIGLLTGCSALAAPPPDAVDDDPRSVRATDPDAAEPGADEAVDEAAVDEAAVDEADDELPPNRIHPEQFVSLLR